MIDGGFFENGYSNPQVNQLIADEQGTDDKAKRQADFGKLQDIAARDVSALLARQADLLRDDADLLDALSLELDPTDAKALQAAPLPLARRAVRRWLANGSSPRFVFYGRLCPTSMAFSIIGPISAPANASGSPSFLRSIPRCCSAAF